MIFLDWRQSGAPGWIEARTGCGSIDFTGGVGWIRGCGALGALDPYLRERSVATSDRIWGLQNISDLKLKSDSDAIVRSI